MQYPAAAAIENNVFREQWYTMAEFVVLFVVVSIQIYVMQNWFGNEQDGKQTPDDWA